MKVFSTFSAILLLAATPVLSTMYNAPCSEDKYCHVVYTSSYGCEEGHCMRKAFTYDNHECIGVIVIILISMFANAGGLGAGAVMIPVYMIFYSFSATDSVPLSKITIFAGAIVNLILSWNTRHHKDPNRFLINYNQAAVIIPLLLAGTQIGVILSKLFPPIAIIGGLVYFLQKTSVSMYKRAKKEWLTEQESKRQQVGKPCVTKEQEMEIKLPGKLGNQILEDDRSSHKVVSDSLEKSDETGQTQPEDSSQSRPDEEGDKRLGHLPVEIGHSKKSNDVSLGVNKSTDEVVPLIVLLNQQLANFGFMILSLAVILVTALLLGGEGQESLVKVGKCSSASFIFLVFSQVVSILISFKAYAHNKHALDENSRHEGEENTSDNSKITFLVVCYITGIAAGALGIGGGMILGPYMLAMGIDAQTSTALSGFIVVFTSSSTSFQFTVAGAIHIRHAWMFMITSLIGSVIGGIILKRIIKKYNRPSLIIWIVFGILILALIVLPAQMIYKMMQNTETAFSFGSLC